MIKKIGVVANLEKKKSKEASEDIIKFLKGQGIEVLELKEINKSQLVITIGGDGMLLHTSHFVRKIPVLPLHCGSLGFLSQIDPAQFKKQFSEIKNGNFEIENRMMLSAVSSGRVYSANKSSKLDHYGRSFLALNDFVVERKTHRAIVLDVKIGDEPLFTYLTDGLIVATPTGSTAYSFATGGPIVNPLVPCLILTPVSAHTLMNRSFVLPADETVKIFPKDDCFLIIDGQEKISICKGEPIIIKKTPFTLKLVKIGKREFYNSVRTKLL